MTNIEASRIVFEYLTDKRQMDSEVFEAIRVQYLSCPVADKEKVA